MCKFYGTRLGLLKASGTESFILEHDAVVQSAQLRWSMCSNASTSEVRLKLYTVFVAGVPSDFSCRSLTRTLNATLGGFWQISCIRNATEIIFGFCCNSTLLTTQKIL